MLIGLMAGLTVRYQEFAMLAGSDLSGIVALTLSPVMRSLNQKK